MQSFLHMREFAAPRAGEGWHLIVEDAPLVRLAGDLVDVRWARGGEAQRLAVQLRVGADVSAVGATHALGLRCSDAIQLRYSGQSGVSHHCECRIRTVTQSVRHAECTFVNLSRCRRNQTGHALSLSHSHASRACPYLCFSPRREVLHLKPHASS